MPSATFNIPFYQEQKSLTNVICHYKASTRVTATIAVRPRPWPESTPRGVLCKGFHCSTVKSSPRI